MATVQQFDELQVWQKARILSKAIWRLTLRSSIAHDFELRNQINGSSGSIMDNIAEGFGRGSRAEFVQFLGYSLGSADETKSQLFRALDRSHLTQEQFDELYQQAIIITKMLVSFINYLNQTTHKGFKRKLTNSVQEPEPFYQSGIPEFPDDFETTNHEPQTTN